MSSFWKDQSRDIWSRQQDHQNYREFLEIFSHIWPYYRTYWTLILTKKCLKSSSTKKSSNLRTKLCTHRSVGLSLLELFKRLLKLLRIADLNEYCIMEINAYHVYVHLIDFLVTEGSPPLYFCIGLVRASNGSKIPIFGFALNILL